MSNAGLIFLPSIELIFHDFLDNRTDGAVGSAVRRQTALLASGGHASGGLLTGGSMLEDVRNVVNAWRHFGAKTGI